MSEQPAYDFDIFCALQKKGDYVHLLEYVKPFAEAEDSYAQCGLAFIYQFGIGVPQDASQAEHWLVKAANQNNPVAWNNLGTLYTHTDPSNPSKAKQCYKRAVELGFTPATLLAR